MQSSNSVAKETQWNWEINYFLQQLSLIMAV